MHHGDPYPVRQFECHPADQAAAWLQPDLAVGEIGALRHRCERRGVCLLIGAGSGGVVVRVLIHAGGCGDPELGSRQVVAGLSRLEFVRGRGLLVDAQQCHLILRAVLQRDRELVADMCLLLLRR